MNLIEVEFPITEVTVYPTSAMITRKKKLTLTRGENRIVILKLPEALTIDTVRVESGNSQSVSITDLSVEDSFIDNYDENKYRQANSELNIMTSEQQKIEAAYRRLNEEFLLFLNKESLVDTIKRDNFRSINVKNWNEFFGFLHTQLASNRNTARETVFKWLELERKIKAAEANLVALESYDRIKEHTIAVTLNAVRDGDEDLILKYLAQSVSWYPAYTIRSDIDKKEISVGIYAMVSQSTGEDWENVSLHLSTAVPLSDCDVPELASLRIKEKAADVEKVSMAGFDRPEYKDAQERLAADEKNIYMDKKTDLYSEMASIAPSVQLRSKASKKKSKESSGGREMAKSVAARFSPGAPISTSIVAEVDASPSMIPIDPEPVFGGTAAIETLVRNVEARILEPFPIDQLAGYYRDYGSFIRDTYSPEDLVPRIDESKANLAFMSGVSPLASMGGFDYRFEVNGKVDSIPSSGSPIQIGVDIARFALDLSYVSVPIENESVYLKATFQNTHSTPFPKGPAQIFSGNDFICNIMFPTVGLQERSSLSLGIDRDIKIIRREEHKRKTGGFIKKEILSECRVEIELASYKDHDIDVLVYDRIPMSEKPREVEIANASFLPEPVAVTERNIVIFRAHLGHRAKTAIALSYTIKHPEDYRLTMRNADHPHYDSEGGAL